MKLLFNPSLRISDVVPNNLSEEDEQSSNRMLLNHKVLAQDIELELVLITGCNKSESRDVLILRLRILVEAAFHTAP